MQGCVDAYAVLTQRWRFITQIKSFGKPAVGRCRQEVGVEKLDEGVDVPAAVLEYFEALYHRAKRAHASFQSSFVKVFEQFCRATCAADINLNVNQIILYKETGVLFVRDIRKI